MNNEHDIVIEFGTSLDSEGNFKQYEVANGSVFNFDYSETLDSATILIPHVALDNRLWNIKPYDFVRVYDKLSGTDPNRPGRYQFDKNYLIDSFNEQEENIEEHIFTYTINLMSETKLLEKIQCPNLAITHNINDDGTTTKKTIYDYLGQYLSLYCPKAKVDNGNGTWSYKPIIRMPITTGLLPLQQDAKNSEVSVTNGININILHDTTSLNSFEIIQKDRSDLYSPLLSDIWNDRIEVNENDKKSIYILDEFGPNELDSFNLDDDWKEEVIDEINTHCATLIITNNIGRDIYIHKNYSFGSYAYYEVWYDQDTDRLVGNNYATEAQITIANAILYGGGDIDFDPDNHDYIKVPAFSTINIDFYLFKEGINGDYDDSHFDIEGFLPSSTGPEYIIKTKEDLILQNVDELTLEFYNKLDSGITIPAGYIIAEQTDIDGEDDISIAFTSTVNIPAHSKYEVGTILVPSEESAYTYFSATGNNPILLDTIVNDIMAEADDTFFNKFNVTAADMVFTTPTLRQLFTMLMEQVGCIPVVENRTLSYLDFRAEPDSFAISGDDYTVNHTVSKISRSLSSDSYVNTLVSMDSQLLDDNNIVINEVLGFRDRNTLFLKQEQNLVLETRYPIYKVEKFGLLTNVFGSSGSGGNASTVELNHTWQYNWYPPEATPGGLQSPNYILKMVQSEPTKIIVEGVLSYGGGAYLNDGPITVDGVSYDYWTWCFEDAIFDLFDEKNTGTQRGAATAFTLLKRFTFDNKIYMNIVEYSSSDAECVFEFPSFDEEALATVVRIRGKMYPVLARKNGSNWEYKEYAPWLEGKTKDCDFFRKVGDLTDQDVVAPKVGIIQPMMLDLSKLCVESSQRGLLDRNFKAMALAETIDDISKYIYATVGYGQYTKTISGFSEVYLTGEASALGWIQSNYTFIENIINFLTKFKAPATVIGGAKPQVAILDKTGTNCIYEYNYEGNYVFTNTTWSMLSAANLNFSYLSFYLEYKPINSVNLSYVKTREDVPYTIEQYSSSASGLSDLDRVSTTQQEQVDRIGNETLTITQVTRNFGNIRSFDDSNGGQRPLLFKDDLNRDGDYADTDEDIQYTIYRMSYAIKNYKYDVSYVGSKDAILKNYFTSIRTKYRAYQNVDYNQATTRKEKDVVFVRIGEDYYDGDDKIKFFKKSTKSNFFCVDVDNSSKLLTMFLKDTNKEYGYKNEISIVSTKNMFSINYEDFDNVSPGLYLDFISYDIRIWDDKNTALGGVPQTWYFYENIYNPSAQILYSFKNSMELQSQYSLLMDNFDLSNPWIQRMPKVSYPFENFDNAKAREFISFAVCNNNKMNNISSYTRLFYKDVSEIINYTLEFIYYTTSENVKWNQNFIAANGFIQNADGYMPNAIVEIDDIPLDNTDWETFLHDEEYRGYYTHIDNYSNLLYVDNNGDTPCIVIKWIQHLENAKFVKLVVHGTYPDRPGTYYRDFIAFKRPKDSEGHYVSESRFYLTLNDTKSDYILSERNGILFKSHKVALNTMDRNVLPENAIWYREDDDND